MTPIIPFYWFVLRNYQGEDHASFLVLIFPLIGLMLLIAAIRGAIEAHKFGPTFFHLETLSGVIGGKLTGFIRTPFDSVGDIVLVLTCNQSERKSNDISIDKIIWESKMTIDPSQTRFSAEGATIPVTFIIPYDCEPTQKGKARDLHIYWSLTLSIETSGTHLIRSYPVPVLRTKESSAQVKHDLEDFHENEEFQMDYLPLSKVHIERNHQELELWFGPARNKRIALGFTLLFALWAGIAYMVYGGNIFLIFVFIPPLIFFIMAAFIWFSTSLLRVGPDGLTVKRGLLGIARAKRLTPEEVEKILANISIYNAAKVYSYSISARLTTGKKMDLAWGIVDKKEANTIVALIETTLGIRGADNRDKTV